ncbi:MAG: hypothetical protein KBA91_01570, partial [Candidatus Moranbacteria bacterium]|nr:hypothetical protein [Candidatus Moranbacteria bacterium]
PKLLGQYKDVGAMTCPNGVCPEYSESVLEGFAGENLSFKAVFMPNFLATQNPLRQWTVDGASVSESGTVLGGAIAFNALKTAPDIYNVGLEASVVQPTDIRQALRDVWGISPLDSPEIHFSSTIQVELKEPGFAQGKLQGSKKYLAAIASYIPASVIFSFRIVLSVILLLFTANILYALLPEQAALPKGYFRKS